MPIVFDQVEGTVQSDTAEAAPAPTAQGTESEASPPDTDKLLRELTAAARRRQRLMAD